MTTDSHIADPKRLIAQLEDAGVELWEEDGRIRFRAPTGVLTDERKRALRESRDEVIDVLRTARVGAQATPDPQHRFEPFPLTDVQSAYLLGRYDTSGLGGTGCHSYAEVHYPSLDPLLAERAWNVLISRHDMLRCVVSAADGYQRILPTAEHYQIAVADARGTSAPEREALLESVRSALDHQMTDPSIWPLFELRITRTDDGDILHVSFDSLTADWSSAALLMAQLEALIDDPDADIPAPEISFRDYVLAERRLRDGARYQSDRAYWLDRIDELPPAPDLGYLDTSAAEARFERHHRRLTPSQWSAVSAAAQRHNVTPAGCVLTAYAAVLQRWSRRSEFTLDLTLHNRLDLHPEVDAVIGDFTSVGLLAVPDPAACSFATHATSLQGRLADDLGRRLFSGVEVLRELARRKGREAAVMPVVFTSGIGVGPAAGSSRGRQGVGLTQTPQVALDCQVTDDADGLRIDMDTRIGSLPPGLVEDMADALCDLLVRLGEEETWDLPVSGAALVPLPAWQREERTRANDTASAIEPSPLHARILDRARRTPHAPAVIGPDVTLSYEDLIRWAGDVAERLRADGVSPGDAVGIVMIKGVEQVVAVLGTLLVGASYVPIDTTSPAGRREQMLTAAGARIVLTQKGIDDHHSGATVIAVEPPGATRSTDEVLRDSVPCDSSAPAYVTFTSGSTGAPKGVSVAHAAAWNTVADICARFDLQEHDRVLGVAQLGFDLAVFDVFGPLSVGGALVLPAAGRRMDPSHWATLIAEHQVTLWNSVPAQMHLLVEHLEAQQVTLDRLRVVLLSGDWIPVTLPDRIRSAAAAADVVSLGGATEAAIWSIHHPIGHPVGDDVTSIPYGRPLANQGFRALDADGRDAPVWVPGELHITGAGLAREYVGDPALTEERFPRLDGQRTYRTGDLGRYLPGGAIEFLGREDAQVKIRGHRIELGEIESALLADPGVGAAAVTVVRRASGEQALVAFAKPARCEVDAAGLARFGDTVTRVLQKLPHSTDQHPLDRAVAAAAHRAAAEHAVHHASPLRVVEILAATGRTTAVLTVLAGFDIDYLVTDRSAPDLSGLMTQTAARLRTGAFDPVGNLREQGYPPGSADLLICGGGDPGEDQAPALAHAMTWLRPGGVLILVAPAGSQPVPPARVLARSASDAAGSAILVTVAAPDRSPLRSDDLLLGLKDRLPGYMIPTQLQVVDQLPVTANGKIDRSVLADWEVAADLGSGVEAPSPLDAVEEQVSAVWADALGVTRIGRHDSFFDLGADSLIMARVAGRLREEVPQAETVEFDVLLRTLLNEPTLAALSDLLHRPSGLGAAREVAQVPAATGASPEHGRRVDGSNALVVPFGGEADGPLRVIFHAALGTLDTFQSLGSRLAEQDLGPVVGIAVADWDEYCEHEPADLLTALADDYTEALLAQPTRDFQLIGHSLGGLLAVEVARRMVEAGHPVRDVTLIDSVPTLVPTDDEIALEAVFVPNLKLDAGEAVFAGLRSSEVFRAFMHVHDQHNGAVPSGALAEVGGDAGLHAVAEAYLERAALPQQERLAEYAQACAQRAGLPVEPELIPSLYRVFRHSLLASAVELDPYLGDITLLRAAERHSFGIVSGLEQLAVPYWRDTCLGELTVIDVDGHHLSCIEEPHVARVADLIGEGVAPT